MFRKILIANRGEIACRVIRTARRMGIATVAVYSDADAQALHVELADEAVHIGPAPTRDSYLVIERIIAACRETGADAVHPGYGFLSENARFAEALEAAGIVFIGPPASAIAAMGDKITAKRLAAEAGVSVVPGQAGEIASASAAIEIAESIGYPVMLKASAGGGGKGMRIAHDADEVREGFERAGAEASAAFGDGRLFIEKFIENPRHIEIQVLADAHGLTIHLGERECSIQRRNQKVIEEAPSPLLDANTRAAMGAQAVALAKAVGYRSAGTVEFVADSDQNFYFLEMNTRLQVEHPVTELVTGLDLVELMIRIAAGEPLVLRQEDVRLEGWAIEARVYAEDPYRNFLPSTGRLTRYRPPEERADETSVVRIDGGVLEGGEISPYYDPMISKLCSWGPSRDAAIATIRDALDQFELEGIGHNLPFLATVFGQQRFRTAGLTTGYIAEEFPDGFNGPVLSTNERQNLIQVAAALRWISDQRVQIGREPGGAAQRDYCVGGIDEAPVAVIVEPEHLASTNVPDPGTTLAMRFENNVETVRIDWRPGDTIARLYKEASGGHGWAFNAAIKTEPTTLGYRLRYRGVNLNACVLPPHIAALMPLMPVKTPPDRSNQLLCPMPGQVVRLDVAEGDIVEEGQALAIVEAMKMENVLRAQKRARVAALNVAVGDVLAVDAVMMEFEAP
ncbi:acetyl/propionyl-CoA carboxylase subuit alpha [Devosia pacifica]|uniref:propionyl-CoA carboxylase n=1 Tax=Devosia pacifica TaxID=1335967 RepID=A0A918S4Y2_9HYPH|nr:acetyl/propionyl/methylcrotonyl-CoA carboxylase subunit alpha [Devosia pacifica]GHA20741.1 acetyl/propionyl-CoA carboxylase subuit alpha [Devosia pacifica]